MKIIQIRGNQIIRQLRPMKQMYIKIIAPVSSHSRFPENTNVSHQILLDRDFPKMLKEYRFKGTDRNNDNIYDIYDGEEYKKHFHPGGFLAEPTNFSLSFNTDGVSIYRTSSKGELWPVYLVINELPPKIRYLICMRFRQNIIK